MRNIIKTATELQDLLGTVHDSYVYADWLREDARDLPARDEKVIQALLYHLQRERLDCLNRAGRIWKELTGRRSVKRLAKIIGSPNRN